MASTSGISFSGLASGLDTTAIVQQLVALERLPIQLAQSQQAEEQSKLDRLGQFRDLVSGLQEKAEELSTSDGFTSLVTSGHHPDVLSVSAASGALQGTHTVEVLELAGTDRWAFNGVTDPDADLATAGGQQVAFDLNGSSYSLSFDTAGSSLNAIAAEINSQAGDDVSASVVNTGTASSPQYQLVLASKDSGEDARFTNIRSTVSGLGISYSEPDGDGDPTSSNHLTVGANAQAIIDGLTVSRADNDFSDVLDGITLDIVGVGTTTFTVEPDKAAIRAEIDGFVEAYNDVISFINTQNTFTPATEDGEAGTSGELFGDTVLSSVKQAMNRGLFNVSLSTVLADTEGYSTLSNVGINVDSSGLLSIDDEVFDEKLAANLEAFTDLFVDLDGFERDPAAEENTPNYYVDVSADSGLLAGLARELDRLFGNLPNGDSEVDLQGIFDLREDTFRTTIERIEGDISAKERRLEDYEEGLVLRFARLEELMGQLNAQGASLASSLAG